VVAVNEALLRVQYQLTDRDLILLGWLADHGTLTTPQITNALYGSLRFAQRRLTKLVEAGLLDRFRPQKPDGGTHPNHYVLTQLGVEVVAAQRDEPDLPRRDAARKRRWWLTNRANLVHLLAVNEFFTDLAGHARTHPGTGLERWWPSARCQRPGAFEQVGLDEAGRRPMALNVLFSATIAADGHGVWIDATGAEVARVPFFAEIDMGTEDLVRVAGKVHAYERFAHATGLVWPVLFWLGSHPRERHLHDRLRQPNTFVPIATATRDAAACDGTGPADRVWWLHGHHASQRVTLADLATTVTRTPQRASIPSTLPDYT
jgi:Replication-relaxation